MNERLIDVAHNNNDKAYTYKQLMGRHSSAMKHGFYFESMFIAYAVLEDRLRSYLYYFAVLQSRSILKFGIKNKTKDQLTEIIFSQGFQKKQVRLQNITAKIDIIRYILNWSQQDFSEAPLTDEYMRILKTECESLDIAAILQTLSETEEWLKYRNEAVHGLMNKNYESIYNELEAKVVEGLKLGRALDKYLEPLKGGKKNRIRKKLKLGL